MNGEQVVDTDVDLSQLAVDRGDRAGARSPAATRGHPWSRYVLPGAVILGVAALIGWAARDLLSPPRRVTVIPVFATQAAVNQEGAPLFKAAGWIEPRPTPVRVAALAPGVVDQLLVVEDQPVTAGEAIAELVKDDARLACERAEADLKLREAEQAAARATLAAARTRFDRPVHLEAALAEAEAELAAVETQLANLPFETRRAEAMLAYAKGSYEAKSSAGGAVTGRAIEEARSQYESARALAEELRGRVTSLEKQKVALARRRDALEKQFELRADELQAKDEAGADLQATAARVEQARVALAEAKLQFDRMTVRSTIDGRVLHLTACPGSRLTIGRGREGSHDGSTVVTLYRPEMLQARVDVRFEDLPRVQLGQTVSIESPAVPSPISGEVLSLGSEADIQKNTLEVKVAIHSPPLVLKPEMLVDVTFLAPKSRQGDSTPSDSLRLFIPERVITRDGGESFVWAADQSAGVARRTPVELCEAGPDGFVEVTRGLNVTSRIIASGYNDLRDGQRIRITGEATDASPVAEGRQ
jgi:HlyD family secretion protein